MWPNLDHKQRGPHVMEKEFAKDDLSAYHGRSLRDRTNSSCPEDFWKYCGSLHEAFRPNDLGLWNINGLKEVEFKEYGVEGLEEHKKVDYKEEFEAVLKVHEETLGNDAIAIRQGFEDTHQFISAKLNAKSLVIDFSLSPSIVYVLMLDFGVKLVYELFCDEEKHVAYTIYEDDVFEISDSGTIEDTVSQITYYMRNARTKFMFSVLSKTPLSI